MKKPIKSEVKYSLSAGVVSLQEVSDHLSLFGDTTYNTYLTRLIVVASTFASNFIGESLESSTIVDYYNGWDSRLELSKRFADSRPAPSVTYYDSSNVVRTLTTASIIDGSGETAALVYTAAPLVALSTQITNPITVTYSTSNLNTAESEAIKQAVLMIISDLFHDRADNIEGSRSKAHITAERLLAPYRRNWV